MIALLYLEHMLNAYGNSALRRFRLVFYLAASEHQLIDSATHGNDLYLQTSDVVKITRDTQNPRYFQAVMDTLEWRLTNSKPEQWCP